MTSAPAAIGRHVRPDPVPAPARHPARRWFEGPLWLLAGVLLAVAMTWPLARTLRTTVPQDAGDPVAQAWQAAWGGHALLSRPLSVFDANTFFPATPSLAFSDSLLGYAPAGMVGSGIGDALVRYNLLFLFAYGVAFAGAALLGRELGLRVPAAVVVGAAYAWAPWKMAQNGHLNILSTGGVALTLFLLVSGYRRARPWQVAAGWLAAAWQVSLGFALGIWFSYLLLTLAVLALAGWLVRGRPEIPGFRGLAAATVGGGLVLVAVAGALAVPYLEVVNTNPDAARGLAEVQFFSPPVRSLLVADATNRLWGGPTAELRGTLPWAPEQTLFPGVAVVLLALVGLRWRGVPRAVRAGLLLAIGVLVVLSFGPRLFDGRLYLPLYNHLPGWDGLRTPGRLAFLWTLALALLAGMGAQRLADALRARAAVLGPVLALLGAAAVLYEGWPQLPIVAPPPPPPALAAVAGPLAELPSDPGNDSTYMWWSTDGFPQLANGNGSYVPPTLTALRTQTTGFPDAASVALLRGWGVRSVVVHRARTPGTPWDGAADRSVDGLGITRQDLGEIVVFDLGGPTG